MPWHNMHNRSIPLSSYRSNSMTLTRTLFLIFCSSSKRFTQHKTAVITIKNFKLIFTRVPLGIHGTMTTEPSLAIECLSFSVLGSSGEAIFGNPKSITDHPELHRWSKCLERDGGAACVLDYTVFESPPIVDHSVGTFSKTEKHGKS